MKRRSPRQVAGEGIESRRLAFEVLLQVETAGAYADILLGRGLAGRAWPASDRGLATRLVYGALAWQRRLDWIADLWAKPAIDRLDPEVRVCLRLGLFQLFFCDRIPAFAAVDTTVELIKLRRPAAAGLVNAVLRRAGREGPPPLPDGVEHLGLRSSHPDWMVERWLGELGPDATEALLSSNNEPAPLTLRAPVNPSAREALRRGLEEHGVSATPGRYSPLAITVGGGIPAALDEEWILQSEASQLVPFLVGQDTCGHVLDACAAPGGKTSQLAELLRDRAIVTAVDLRRTGLARAGELARRRDVPVPVLAAADVRQAPFRPETFDAVLVDAPCSGAGTLRSHPEIRWRVTPDDATDLARRQTEILEATAELVRPGGALVYATCSLFAEENDAVADRFLSARPHWRRVDARAHLPPTAIELASDGVLRTFPHRDGLDGFFAVRLERAVSG